ncbi:MAG: acyltransferase [Polaribacter sp.]
MSFIRNIKSLLGNLKREIEKKLINDFSFFKPVKETVDNINPITLKSWVNYKILRKKKNIYWPVHPTSTVVKPENILIGIDTSPGYSPGCYIQGIGKIEIGDYTGIGPNVGIISANHSMLDFRKHEAGIVSIGKYCWLGMGCIILPNVKLGDFTIVRAGAVVTKSFEQGHCVIGGNPAVIVKQFPKAAYHLFTKYEHEHEYIGYIKSKDFEQYKKQFLKV